MFAATSLTLFAFPILEYVIAFCVSVVTPPPWRWSHFNMPFVSVLDAGLLLNAVCSFPGRT